MCRFSGGFSASIIIPSCNESESLPETVSILFKSLKHEAIEHEILVIDDHSTDKTRQTVTKLSETVPTLRYLDNQQSPGYGFAVRTGLDHFSGDCVAIMMADLSDSPDDLIRFYREMNEHDLDCVFGSRFIRGSSVRGYPWQKLLINRIANTFVRYLFRLKYNDCTNAFKLFKRETIEGLRPFLSPHFNLTLELPLKAIVRQYSYSVLPNSWTNRKYGTSKLNLNEMGSRYLFVLLYCLIEKYFSKNDFQKPPRTIES